MESEITNTILGILRIPAWLEALLAVVSICFILWLGWRKAQRQNDALNALEEASKMQSAVCRESIIEQRNLYGMMRELIENETRMSSVTADIFVSALINSVYYQVQSFQLELKGEKPENLVSDFCQDCYLEFASNLSRVEHANGKRLVNFAEIMRWHFEERLKDLIIYSTDIYHPQTWIRNQLEKEWEKWK